VTDENLDDTTTHDGGIAESPAQQPAAEAPQQYGVGPFSIREVALGGVWLLAFIVSFFPINLVIGPAAALVGGTNVWVSGLGWVLTIGLPTIAVFLIVLRRLSPQGIRRFGSLGIDQFASVAFSVSAIYWLQSVWETVAISIETGEWVRSWVIWVELVLMLAGVVLTVLAPLIPVLEQDFQDRPEAPAHRNARPVRPVVPRPKRERPRPAAPDAGAPATQTYDTGAVPAAVAVSDTGAYGTGSYDTGSYRPHAQTSDTGAYGTDVFAPLADSQPVTEEWAAADETVRTSAVQAAPAQQAFWALAPVERDVVDDYGKPLFRIGPTAWALVIEDRGEAFVVRHEDGRVGYLHDVSGVTRG
jgi:hypothetical protein